MISIATLIVLAMGIVAFAYTTNGTDTPNAKASCTCCGDSCPMKNGEHSTMSGMDMKNMQSMDMKHDKSMKDCPCCHHKMDKKDTAKTGV